MRKKVCLLLSLAVVMLLSGCSGSDSGGNTSSPKAKITSGNASDITESAFQANAVMTAGNSTVTEQIGRSSDEKSQGISGNIMAGLGYQVFEFITEAGLLSSGQARARFQVDDFFGTKYGVYGGSATYTLSRQGQTFRAIIKFDDYSMYPEQYLDGSLILTGKADPDDDSLSGDVDIDFNSFRVYYGSHIDCTVTGSMKLKMSGNLRMIFTANATLKNELKNLTSKIEDYVIDMEVSGQNLIYDISGVFIHSKYGRVDISTGQRFVQRLFEDHPLEGIMLIDGASGTKSRLTIIDSESYTIDADLNGDGSYEWTSGTMYWD
jgi:hypothetical protein